jgi:transposase
MFVDIVPNRKSPPAILIRESIRDGAQVRKRTIANISDWPKEKIEALRALLKGTLPPPPMSPQNQGALSDAFDIVRSRPHGHVAVVLGTLRRLGLERVMDRRPSSERDLSVALIAARIFEPGSKLALAQALGAETLHSSLGEELGVDDCTEDALYAAMDWLIARQASIERALAKRHLSESTLVLYDVTSTYFEGRKCPLARFGHSRDGKNDKLQIVFGLLTTEAGCPVAVEVFEGNTGDPKTVKAQIEKVMVRFKLKRIILAGDRGMLTSARIREDLLGAGDIEWITALRAPAIQKLLKQGLIQLSLFDEKDLAEITSPDFPGERLVVCRNPQLAEERKRKREDLLRATEKRLEDVQKATTRAKKPLQGKDKIGLRVGKVIGQFKMGKHFKIEITESSFRFERDQPHIESEAALDGIYVIRTSLSQDEMNAEDAVRSYKRLALVERAFRSLKTVDLKVRPIYHRKANRVRAHVLLCMLAYYVEWHMRTALAPILFDDDDKPEGEALRESVVAPAQRSPSAKHKALTKRTERDEPVHSFRGLLADLATIVKDRVQPRGDVPAFDKVTRPTTLQQRALDLLKVRL